MTSALLVVSGCVKEMPADGSDQSTDSTPTEIAMKSVTLDASMPGAVVKSLVNDEGEFCWTSDDAIAVNVSYVDADGNPANGFFKLDVKEISSENDNVATFEGKIPENGTFEGVAVYPYNEGHVYSDGKLTVNFPTEVSEANHLPMMYAQIADGEALQFKHLSSMLKLTYRYVPKGTDGLTLTSEAVAGLYDVNLETGALTATDNVTDQVKVSFAALTQIQPEKSIYLPVPAGERSIAANLNKGEELVKWSSISSKTAREYVAGYITLLPAVNVNFPELYIVGSSEDLYSWSTSKMEAMEEVSAHVFTWTGKILTGDRFRFPVDKVYYPAVYKVDDNPDDNVDEKKPVVKFVDMGNRNDFTVDRDGYYEVTVNTTDMDNIQVDIEFRYPSLFIVGRATEFAYENSDINDEQWMTMVSDGVYEWTGWLTDDIVENDKTTYGAFKFLAQKGAWYPAYNRVEGEEWKLIENPSKSSGIPDIKFTIKDGDGIYKITANLNTKTVTATLLEATRDLYIVGTSVGFWNSKPATEYKLSYKGNGVFTWTGQMYTSTDNGFKIILYGDYTKHYGPTTIWNETDKRGMDGTAAWHESGEHKWILKPEEYTDGKYTVVLDTVNGTISVTPVED